MFHIVLFEPEIPPNTGNIIRLCANTGAQLHLVKPLGFSLEDKQLKRAGLDYHEYANLMVHENWEACKAALAGHRLFAITTKGSTTHSHIQFKAGDAFVFGPEKVTHLYLARKRAAYQRKCAMNLLQNIVYVYRCYPIAAA